MGTLVSTASTPVDEPIELRIRGYAPGFEKTAHAGIVVKQRNTK